MQAFFFTNELYYLHDSKSLHADSSLEKNDKLYVKLFFTYGEFFDIELTILDTEAS